MVGGMTLPKEAGVRGTRVVVIPAGSFLVVVPLPKDSFRSAGGCLKTGRERAEKSLAEKAAGEDAVSRARRRKQLLCSKPMFSTHM